MQAPKRTVCPIITLCKIANAIVRYPKKYPNAHIFRVSEAVFFLPNALPTLLATLPTTHFSGAGIKRHKFIISQVPVAGANSIVSLHCTSLDLHPPQHRTASVLRNAYSCFFPPPIVLDMPFYPCELFAPFPPLLK